jgi:hypothetical protein
MTLEVKGEHAATYLSLSFSASRTDAYCACLCDLISLCLVERSSLGCAFAHHHQAALQLSFLASEDVLLEEASSVSITKGGV